MDKAETLKSQAETTKKRIQTEIDALATNNISIRIWVKQDSKLPAGSEMYYNGLIQLVENNTSLAINK